MVEVDNYVINSDTLVLLPRDKDSTIIYECNDSYLVQVNAFKIIKDSCLFFGSTYDGRKDATKNFLNCEMKLPILIEESRKILFFPTSSAKKNDTIWVSYNNLINFSKTLDNFTVLYFKGNKDIKIKVKSNIIDNQFVRCLKLDNILKNKYKNLTK